MFDNAFVGSSDEDENLAIFVVKNRRTRMVSLTLFHEKGVVHDQSATQLLADLKLLGYSEVILICDGRTHFEGCARRGETTLLRHSHLREQPGWRQPASLPGNHVVTAWLVSR